jgi:hypothetical protein
MRNRFARAAGVLAFVVAAAGGCASSGATSTSSTASEVGGGGATFPVTIIVDNNLQNLRAVTAYVTVGSSGRKTLGNVESNRKKEFTYQGTGSTYRLYARTTSRTDPEIVSDPVQISGAMTITWHLASNTLVAGQ